jgi:hypothetical protein
MPAEQDCRKPYLQLRSDDRIGTLVVSPNDSSDNNPRRFRILLGNPTKDCIVTVDSICVEVADFIVDHHPALEALTSTHKFKIDISPEDKGRSLLVTDKSFNYPPMSSPDQIIIDAFSKKNGVAYALRFVAKWSDFKTGTHNIAKSWIAVAPYPDGQGELLGGGSDAFAWCQQQLISWRREFDKNDPAIQDASIEDPGYKLQWQPLRKPAVNVTQKFNG